MTAYENRWDGEYEHQKKKVEPLDKKYDELVRVSKQDNHYQMDRETMPHIIEFLDFMLISRLSFVEMEQARDDLKRVERDRL